MKKYLSAAVLAVPSMMSPMAANAINITTTGDATNLASALFLNFDSLTITGFPSLVSGEFGQAGVYQNPQGTYGLPASGIVLSTGNVEDYGTGPNENSGTTTSYGDGGVFDESGPVFVDGPGPGEFEDDFPEDGDDFFASNSASIEQEEILGAITGVDRHFDPVQLSIDFFATEALVSFFAVFGSEEFPEFVGGSVTDGFGLLVNGVNVASVGGLPVNIDHPQMQAFSGTELDGVLAPGGNPVLRFDVPVNLGEVNTFDIILADAGDDVVDTTVYLSSFFADPGTGGAGPTGATEFDPLLPLNGGINPETGAFEIVLPEVLDPETTIWIDPPVTVGYTYVATGGEFDVITAPSLATVPDLDGYFISVGGAAPVALPAGGTLDLVSAFGFAPTEFTLSGIDESLGLDPTNPLAFPLGVSFLNTAFSATVDITPITVNSTVIPLPAGGLLYLSLFGVGIVASRRYSLGRKA